MIHAYIVIFSRGFNFMNEVEAIYCRDLLLADYPHIKFRLAKTSEIVATFVSGVVETIADSCKNIHYSVVVAAEAQLSLDEHRKLARKLTKSLLKQTGDMYCCDVRELRRGSLGSSVELNLDNVHTLFPGTEPVDDHNSDRFVITIDGYRKQKLGKVVTVLNKGQAEWMIAQLIVARNESYIGPALNFNLMEQQSFNSCCVVINQFSDDGRNIGMNKQYALNTLASVKRYIDDKLGFTLSATIVRLDQVDLPSFDDKPAITPIKEVENRLLRHMEEIDKLGKEISQELPSVLNKLDQLIKSEADKDSRIVTKVCDIRFDAVSVYSLLVKFSDLAFTSNYFKLDIPSQLEVIRILNMLMEVAKSLLALKTFNGEGIEGLLHAINKY